MISRSKRFVLFFILIFSGLIFPGAWAAEIPDMPDRYVVDLAGIIDKDAKEKIDGYLADLEQKTTAQFLVLTVDTLEGVPIEDYSLRVAEKWKLGQKGKDNGLLLLVALKDRGYRFEVGYGLEGILPDSLVGSIGRQYLVPNFRRGDFSGGIYAAVIAAAGEIARDSGVSITGMPEISPAGERKRPGLLKSALGIIFFIAMIILFLRHPGLFLLLFLSGRGGRGWYWGTGGGRGGFGGGGFGGFGGGGGGGFGGGGASGRW